MIEASPFTMDNCLIVCKCVHKKQESDQMY